MFNEKSNGWINIYHGVVITLFILIISFGVIGAFGDASAEFLDIGLGGDDDGILDFMVWILISGIMGVVYLVTNMLIIQLLNNIQIIREKMENISKENVDTLLNNVQEIKEKVDGHKLRF
ncbi:MAG: hypothetical protein IJO77_04310 [Oscillospiraceae bacterium]|nr:hypothetical protein [Oscillospiraceae bacterium]